MDLSQYLDQGQFDSQGRFTMDPARARELLRDYALPQGDYVLSLVCFLIGMGASAVRVQVLADRLEIAGEGLVLPRELLANPLEGLFSARRHPALRELALGMNAALALARSVTLRSGGLQGCYSKEFELSPWPGEETLFVVHGRPAGELEALVGQFEDAQAQVWLQGQLLSAPSSPPLDCFVLELAGGGLAPLEHPARYCKEHPGPVQARFWLGNVHREPWEGNCGWVYLGRTYPMPLPFQLEGLEMQMWVACNHLDRDLSLKNLLQNETYGRVCTYLRQQLAAGLDEVLELYLGGWRPPQLRPVALWALERAGLAGQLSLALELQQALGIDTRLDQLRLDLLERRNPPEFQGNPAELWEAARAYLAIKGPRHHATTRLLFRAGEQAYLKGDYAQAARCFGPFLSSDPPRSGQVRAQHGHCLLMQGQLQEARHHLTQAVRGGGEQAWVLTAMENLAAVDAALGCPREASQTLLQVLSRRQAVVGSRSGQLGLVLNKLVALSHAQGDPKGAAKYQQWADSLDR